MSTLGQIIGQLTLGAIAGSVLSAVLGEELSTRMNLLPHVLIRLAARHLPADMRADRIEEWNAELAAVAGQTEGLPLTRFLRGLSYGLSLFLNTGALTSALVGRPRISLTLAAGRRTLVALTHLAAGCYALAIAATFHNVASGALWWDVLAIAVYGCLAVAALLRAVWQYVPNVGVLQLIAQRLGVVGLASLPSR